MNSSLTTTQRPWARSDEGILAGVCQGIAERFDIDPWILRIALLLSLFAFGTGAIAYLILGLTLPRESDAHAPAQKRVLGVCMQLSRTSGIDVGLVRALTVFSAIASFGVTIVAYGVLYFVFEQKSNDVVI